MGHAKSIGIAAIALLVIGDVAVAEDSKGSLTVDLENDLFGSGTDAHYTHGTEITYVSDRDWAGEAQGGVVVGGGNWRFTLTEIYRSREFYGQNDPDEFGSITVSYRL